MDDQDEADMEQRLINEGMLLWRLSLMARMADELLLLQSTRRGRRTALFSTT